MTPDTFVKVPEKMWAAVKAVLRGDSAPSTPGQWYDFLVALEQLQVEEE